MAGAAVDDTLIPPVDDDVYSAGAAKPDVVVENDDESGAWNPLPVSAFSPPLLLARSCCCNCDCDCDCDRDFDDARPSNTAASAP